MKGSSINLKLLFLILFPIFGIGIFSFASINSAINTVKQTEKTIEIIQLSLLNNALVHELQKERGMSNVYFHSQGKNFLNELKEQRKLTDALLLKHKRYLKQLKNSDKQFVESINIKGLEALLAIRVNIEQLAMPSAKIISYYSKINTQLIDTIFLAIEISTNNKINNLLHSYYNLAKSKEFAGIERALLADISTVNGFTQAKILAVNAVRTKENVHLALFNQLASADMRDFYQQAMSHKSIEVIKNLRSKNLNAIDSKTWFFDATERINQLQSIEQQITHVLLLKFNKLKSETQTSLLYSGGYGFLSIAITILILVKLLNQLARENEYRKELEQQKETLHQFKLIVDNTLNSIVITDPDGVIEYVNKRFIEISGFKAEQVIGEKPKLWRSDNTGDEIYQQLYATITQGDYWQGELQNKRHNNELYWTRTTMFPVKSSQGQIVNYVCIQEDITQQKYDKETIEHLVNHDTLTGLPSLRLGKDRLAQAILAAQRHNLSAAVMFIDLDGFKEINDEFGHAAGDKVLIEVGQRIVNELRQTDTVARIGGDEFIVIMTNIKNEKAISNVAQKIIETVKEPIYDQGSSLFVTASIGIAQYPLHGNTGAELLKNADQAMYSIKNIGKNNYAMFSDFSQ
jgi:diguanylate cyclase (GGDEF)-like protein/PAS domain S-box-containing protein